MADPRSQPPDAGFGPVEVACDRSLPGVLRVHVRGHGGDPDAAFLRWRRFLAMAREAGLRRLLVVRDLEGPLIGDGDLATLVERLAGEGLEGIRVALVQTRHDRQRTDELGSLLAMSHGAAVRVFPDEATAALWLRHGGE